MIHIDREMIQFLGNGPPNAEVSYCCHRHDGVDDGIMPMLMMIIGITIFVSITLPPHPYVYRKPHPRFQV